jgi:hypothetical protein
MKEVPMDGSNAVAVADLPPPSVHIESEILFASIPRPSNGLDTCEEGSAKFSPNRRREEPLYSVHLGETREGMGCFPEAGWR